MLVGGEFEWLPNCGLVVAADDLIAFFPEMQLGHFITGGVSHLLPMAGGHQRSMEMFILREQHDAQSLHRLGIVNRVVPRAEVLATARELARQVASRSTKATSLLKRVT